MRDTGMIEPVGSPPVPGAFAVRAPPRLPDDERCGLLALLALLALGVFVGALMLRGTPR